MTENIWYLSFWDWLNALNMTVSSHIHLPKNNLSSFFIAKKYIVYVYPPHFPFFLLDTWAVSYLALVKIVHKYQCVSISVMYLFGVLWVNTQECCSGIKIGPNNRSLSNLFFPLKLLYAFHERFSLGFDLCSLIANEPEHSFMFILAICISSFSNLMF